jgi:hypothetical protein
LRPAPHNSPMEFTLALAAATLGKPFIFGRYSFLKSSTQ